MLDDPHIIRILKRYPKGDKFSDVFMDVTSLGVVELLQVSRCDEAHCLDVPKELDDQALSRVASKMGIEFDPGEFDYFLHSYVRLEYFPAYYEDPSVTSKPPPEFGAPPKIPLPKGMRWVSVRPKDGQEHYEAHEINEPNNKV
jgi:hypothetical protein